MYHIIYDETLASLRNNAPQKIRIAVNTANESFELTQSNLTQGSCSVDRYCCSGERIEIGSAIAAELKLTLKNAVITYNGQEYNPADITFEGAEMHPFCLVPSVNGSYEEIPLGVFTVDEPPRKLSTITIKALDRMMRFDVAHDGAVGTSLLVIVQHCCDLAGVTLSSSAITFLNGFAGVYTLPETIADKEDLVCRQVLMWVGEMTASCAYIDENGYLDFKQYPQTHLGAMVITEADRYSSDIQESDITITGITVTPTDSKSEAVTIGVQGYEWNIEGNQLLVSPDEMASAPLGYSDKKFFAYRPFTASTKSFPHLWPLDAIVFSKTTNDVTEVHNSVITHHTWKLNGSSSISAVGKTATKNGYATHGGFTAKQKAVLERAVKGQVKTQISGYQQAILDINEVAQRATGLYNTTDEDTGITYYHNQPAIADSTYIYMESTAGRFMATGANAWNDGSPVWTNAWTSMGQLVVNSLAAGSITTDMLNIGGAANAENRTSSVIVDKTGIDIYDGAIKIYDKNGKLAVTTDSSGNLSLVGTIKTSSNNSYYAELTYGGLYFYDGTTLVNKLGIEKFIDRENNTETLITTTEKGLNIKSGQILTNSSLGSEPFAGLKHFRRVIGGSFSVGLGIGKANSDKSATGSIEVRDEYYSGAPIYSRLDFTKSTVGDCVIDIRGSYDVNGEMKYSKWLSLGERYMVWGGDIALNNTKAIYGYTTAGTPEILIQKSSGNNVVIGHSNQSGVTNIYTQAGGQVNVYLGGTKTFSFCTAYNSPCLCFYEDNEEHYLIVENHQLKYVYDGGAFYVAGPQS